MKHSFFWPTSSLHFCLLLKNYHREQNVVLQGIWNDFTDFYNTGILIWSNYESKSLLIPCYKLGNISVLFKGNSYLLTIRLKSSYSRIFILDNCRWKIGTLCSDTPCQNLGLFISPEVHKWTKFNKSYWNQLVPFNKTQCVKNMTSKTKQGHQYEKTIWF